MKRVNLGDEVKDKITGFRGVVIGITRWLNGCSRVGIQPRKVIKDKGKIAEAEWTDENQLDIVKRGALKPIDSVVSGPTSSTPTRQRDPR